MVFGRSSPGEHASIYQTRMPAHGVFETSARLSAGVAPHTRLRWGDYNGVANDPIDPARIWVYGGYGITNDRWATWIASLEPSVPGGAPALLALEEEPAPGALRVRSGGAATFEIEFVVERSGGVRLEVFDVTGRRVRLLSDGFRETGVHRAEWDGRSDDGASLASGLYWLRLRSEAGTATERVTFLK
jgi:hypothetical protein